jgi:alpha-tubulin suppressor-like RCC1 family protein
LNNSNISVQYSTGSNYIIETVKSDLFIPDLVTSTSNLTAEPYLESGERAYPVSRLFTTNDLTLTNQYYESIACGYYHTVFLTNDGKVYSCGNNFEGELGLGNTTNQPTPQPISTLNSLTISAIAGGEHTVFLTNDGKVYSCGRNTGGELGRLVDASNPAATPSIIPTLNSFTITAIACGANHTIFLTNDGKVYSCGLNTSGQLGQSTTTTTPSIISTLNSFTITAIACGTFHTVFLTNDGKVYSCGDNATGNLGLGNTTSTTTPQPISTLNSLTITAIAGGRYHTVFLTNDGKVYSCGFNEGGQLGLGNTTQQTTPQPISTLNSFTITAIACGRDHTVFLTNDGKVYSCGSNGNGQLGRTVDTTNPSSVPSIIPTLNSFTISAIACGEYHTVFLTNDGKVYSCGNNGSGQLGQSTTTTTPSIISTLNSFTISAIACGISHTVFLTNDGKVYSCGNNGSGQLGQSTTTTTPSIISTTIGSLTISAIAGGYAHTVFLTNEGKVYSCGDNGANQLGRTVDASNPGATPSIVNTFQYSSIYGSGLYTVSYSSFTSSFEPFKCFNENSTANNQGTWRSGDYLSTGLFNSATYSTSNLVSGYNGDWLVIKLPLSIKLKRFAIKQLSTALNSAPRNFRLYGSTTGTSLSWTLLIDKQDAVYTSLLYNHTDMSQYASDTNKYYNHFGLVVNALVGSATTLSFDEFYVYGIELLTPITNANTKTLTIPRYTLNNSFLKSYNITFPVLTLANINNNSNLLLQGEYGINLINSTSNYIEPKSGQFIPSTASSLKTSTVSIRYSLINPIKTAQGAQWTYNSLNTSVYHMGAVGIGTTNPGYQLDVRGNIYSSTGGLTQSGLTTWTVLSDRRIKENIVKASYEKCLDNVKNIELYNFNFKDNYVSTNDRHQLGFIAQEVQTVYPKAVEVGNITLNVEEKIDDLLTLNTTQIKYTLYGAVKKLIEKIEDIEMRVEKLYISTISSNIDIDNNE